MTLTTKLKPYPAMKDSGMPWLGEIPEHWEIRRAKWLFLRMERPVSEDEDVVTCFRDGVVTKRRNRRTSGFTESIKEIGYQGIRKGDLVVHAMDAFAGAIGVSDSDGKGSPVYSVCRPAEGAIAQYFADVLREMARNQWIVALAKGVRERSTDFRYSAFAAQPLPLPPLPEQEAVVRFIEYVDRRIRRYIRAKQKLIKLLEEHKQAIIHRAVTGQIDVRTGKPYPAYKPSGIEWLGDVPEHWEVAELKRVLRRLVDCEHKTAPVVDNSQYRVIRTSAVRNGRLRWQGTYCTTEQAFTEWTQRSIPEEGDVIFTREAPAGEACVVPGDSQVCLGQRTVLMKVLKDLYSAHFLVHMIYAGPPKDRIRIASQGSTVGHFNMDDIGWMHVLKPPISEQLAILQHIEHRTSGSEQAINCAQREIELLREYRTRLIAEVVTGKLDVREAAATLPDEPEESETLDDPLPEIDEPELDEVPEVEPDE